MKKFHSFLLVIFVIVGCQQIKKEKQEVRDIKKEKEKVALVLEKYVIANERQDIDLVREIWASSDDIVVIGTNSDEKLTGWEAIRNVMQRQFNSFQDTYISVHDQVIEMSPTANTAWFSEIVNYNYIYQGEAKQYEGVRFTGVLEKIGDDWFIVQSHMSIPASPE